MAGMGQVPSSEKTVVETWPLQIDRIGQLQVGRVSRQVSLVKEHSGSRLQFETAHHADIEYTSAVLGMHWTGESFFFSEGARAPGSKYCSFATCGMRLLANPFVET